MKNEELYHYTNQEDLPWTEAELNGFIEDATPNYITYEQFIKQQFTLNDLLNKYNLDMAAYLEIRAYVLGIELPF